MKTHKKNRIIKRMLASILAVMMVVNTLSPSFTTVHAATGEYPYSVTITVTDENGDALSDASVTYVIDSVTHGDAYIKGTKTTNSNGNMEVLSAIEYIPGDFSITATVSKDGYTSDNTTIVNESIVDAGQNFVVSIKSLTIKGVSVTPADIAYDETYHEAATVSGTKEGDVISYKLGDGEWTSEIPKIKEIGTYSLSVKVERSGYEDYITTVAPVVSKGTFEVSVNALDKTYDGNSDKAVIISDLKDGDIVTYQLNDGAVSLTVPLLTDAGEYKVLVKIHRNDNYEDFVGTYTANIRATEIEGLSATLYSGVYDKEAHDAVTEVTGTKPGDKVEYQLNGGNWSEEVPLLTDAGEYHVSVRVSRKNFLTTEIIGLNPSVVVIEKAEQDLRFAVEHTESSISLNKDATKNVYDFSAVGGYVTNPVITYSVVNDVDSDLTDITEIAEIDENGQLTVKKAGHIIKVIATVAGDNNYKDASVEYGLVIVNDVVSDLASFENETVDYVLGTSDIVASQEALKVQKDDNGTFTYEAAFTNNVNLNLAQAGLTFNKNDGTLSVVDYKNLTSALESNGELSVEITADKSAGTKKSGFFGTNDKIVFDACSISYTATIRFGETPSDAYTMLDPDGNVLTGPNGTIDNTWFNTAVTVVPAEGYMITKDVTEPFETNVVFDDQGEALRRVYLKNIATGEISAPVSVAIDKIDSIAPDSGLISIEYSEPVNKGILWFYNSEVTITVTGYDNASGIDHFDWNYTRSEDASTSNLESDSGVLKAIKGKEEGIYTAILTLPEEKAEQLKGYLTVNATDKAGLKSDNMKDDGRVIVIDTISPTKTVSHELETVGGTQQTVGNHHYYSDNVKFTFVISEANFFAEDVVIKVSKDTAKPEVKEVSWAATEVKDQYEATLLLEEQGDYVVSMTYEDRSGNEMETYESDVVTVDKEAPVITFAYSNGNNTSASVTNEQKAIITIKEHNFRASDVKVDVEAVDINGNSVSVKHFEEYLQKEESWTKDGDLYTAVISDDFADAIYNMIFNYKDLALNEAKEVKTGAFIVDHTAPSVADMEISYSAPITKKVLSAITFGFYNPDVTVTFKAKDTVSGIDFFTWLYEREEGASKTNVAAYEVATIKAIQDASDKSVFTASVTLPKNEAEQLRGCVAFTSTDFYGNTSDKLTDSDDVIVVDTIAPAMTVEYTKSNRTVGSKMYYNKDCTATFTVTEANFYEEDIKVEVLKDCGEFTEVTPTWKDLSADIHMGTYTIKAPDTHLNDGEYVFRVSYTDKSNNQMATYTSDIIVIDTVKPVISVVYDSKNPVNTLKDSEGHNRDYFDAVQTATVTVTERNFVADEVDLSIIAKDVSGNVLDASKLSSMSKWSTSVDDHIITITYPGDANYTFDVAYEDLATNSADDYEKDFFTVDTTAPTDLSVSYSKSILDTVLSGITFGFYNAKMTVTLSAKDTISGVHSFDYSYLKAVGVSNVNAQLVNQAIEEADITFSADLATGTARFEIPKNSLGPNNQFNGTVEFTANDRSENTSKKYADEKRIVVDNIAPTSTVTYNTPVNTEGNIAYYDGNINVTLTVNEANFYAEDVRVSVSKDGAAYGVTPTWRSSSADIHVGTFTLSSDGDYVVSVNYTDKSTNRMVSYTSNQLTIDTEIKEPVITVNGEKADGRAFKDDVIPAVSFEDENFDNYEIKLTRTRYDAKNVDVTEEFIGSNVLVNEKGGSGTFDTFIKEPDVDGIYTLTISITDKAGHSSKSTATFTVNRFGSVYEYDDYLISLIKDGGAYVKAVEKNLIITEYNADKLLEGSLEVKVSRDGKPLDDVDFVTTPEINDRASVGSSGWYQYQYTIDKANFEADGVYKIAVSSKDATGNAPDTSNFEDQTILFRVDSTSPEINSITGLEEKIINAPSVEVNYTVYDSIGLKSIKVFVDEKEVVSITDFSADMNNYEGSFELIEKNFKQTVKLIIEDMAGNVTDTSTDEFKDACVFAFNDEVTVSTNVFVRTLAWVRSHVGVVAGIIVGIIALIWFISFVFRRKKEKKEVD